MDCGGSSTDAGLDLSVEAESQGAILIEERFASAVERADRVLARRISRADGRS